MRPEKTNATMQPADTDKRSRPTSLTDLYLSFTWLSLQGFGGALAVAQRELVERKRWLSNEEFAEEWGVAQILPGPNVVNLAVMLGGRYMGWRGALAALAGMISIPIIVLLLLAIVYAQFSTHPGVTGALRGMGAIAAGLIVATGLRLIPALKRHPLGELPCAVIGILAFIGVGLLRLPLIYVLLGLGAIACGLTYVRMNK